MCFYGKINTRIDVMQVRKKSQDSRVGPVDKIFQGEGKLKF